MRVSISDFYSVFKTFCSISIDFSFQKISISSKAPGENCLLERATRTGHNICPFLYPALAISSIKTALISSKFLSVYCGFSKTQSANERYSFASS